MELLQPPAAYLAGTPNIDYDVVITSITRSLYA